MEYAIFSQHSAQTTTKYMNVRRRIECVWHSKSKATKFWHLTIKLCKYRFFFLYRTERNSVLHFIRSFNSHFFILQSLRNVQLYILALPVFYSNWHVTLYGMSSISINKAPERAATASNSFNFVKWTGSF